MRKGLAVIFLLFVSYGCSSSPLEKSPDVIYVDINNTTGKEDGSFSYPFTSIARAVREGKEGATIIVRPGHYREMEIRMKKGQKLQGGGAENTIIERRGHDLIILSSGCEVSGFFIKSEWSGTLLGPAIAGEGVKDIKIFNNKFYYPDGASIALESASGKIFNNELVRVTLDYCEDVVVENNKMEGYKLGYRWGVFPTNGIGIVGSSPILRNNTIRNCGLAIYIAAAVGNVISSPLIYNNIIENNEYGIKILSDFPCEADLGGGKRGSPGGNIIRNNKKWDLLNESPSTIYAQNNTWTHSTEEEIDKYDICDDDEGAGGKVIFVPFKGGQTSMGVATSPQFREILILKGWKNF